MVKLYTLNARGLRGNQKRREIFSFLKRKQFDIIFIQESHSSPDIEKTWKNEWGGNISFSHHTSKSRGAMTLFKKDIQIKEHVSDSEGRVDLNVININNVEYTCINVYAPNTERERTVLFRKLSATMATKLPTKNIIMGVTSM